MRNYALQKGPCNFLDFRIGEFYFSTFSVLPLSLSLFYPLSDISSVPGSAPLSGGLSPCFSPSAQAPERQRAGALARRRAARLRRAGAGARAVTFR
jgi:hypothetical protein